MQKISAWVSAARLRTLPLSISGILMGTAVAASLGYQDGGITILALLTTIGFQVTSNFANDYGDGVKGTDNESRIGPARALQSGALTARALKRGIIVSVIIDLVLVLLLLQRAFQDSPVWLFLLFIALGVASIWAAISYTVGSSAYGYRGLGDLFVFLFFGLLSVLGSCFLYTQFLPWQAFLPAVAIGLLSTAVLNLNNMRDLESDCNAGKITLAVRMGPARAKTYHFLLVIGSLLCMWAFLYQQDAGNWRWLALLPYLLLALHLRTVYQVKEPSGFDPELKKVALSTFFVALLCYLLYNYFL